MRPLPQSSYPTVVGLHVVSLFTVLLCSSNFPNSFTCRACRLRKESISLLGACACKSPANFCPQAAAWARVTSLPCTRNCCVCNFLHQNLMVFTYCASLELPDGLLGGLWIPLDASWIASRRLLVPPACFQLPPYASPAASRDTSSCLPDAHTAMCSQQ